MTTSERTERIRSDQADVMLASLRDVRGRRTATRRLVIEALVAATESGHVTAEELFGRAQAVYPELAESTVYRTLNSLVEHRLIDAIRPPYGPVVYHLPGHIHAHLQCENCHRIFDLSDDFDLSDLETQLQAAHGFELHPARSALSGLCPACSAAGRP